MMALTLLRRCLAVEPRFQKHNHHVYVLDIELSGLIGVDGY